LNMLIEATCQFEMCLSKSRLRYYHDKSVKFNWPSVQATI